MTSARTPEPQPPEPQQIRRRLLDAGRRLALREAPGELTNAAMATEAGIEPEMLAALYPTVEALQCELLTALVDDVRERVARITANMPAGVERLNLALETYLEANIQRPLLRALIATLRFSHGGAELIQRLVAGFGVMMELELRAVGHPYPAEAARLLTAAMTEIAQAEHETGARHPAMRDVLHRYLDCAA